MIVHFCCCLIVGEEVASEQLIRSFQMGILLEGKGGGARNHWYFFAENKSVWGICALRGSYFGGRIAERRVGSIDFEIKLHGIS